MLKLAVVLDNRVKSVATIQEQIHDQGRITGSFTPQEVQDLALTLRSGALPAGECCRFLHVEPKAGGDRLPSLPMGAASMMFSCQKVRDVNEGNRHAASSPTRGRPCARELADLSTRLPVARDPHSLPSGVLRASGLPPEAGRESAAGLLRLLG